MICPNCGYKRDTEGFCEKCNTYVYSLPNTTYQKTFFENLNKIPARIDLEDNDKLILDCGNFKVIKKLGRGGFGTVYKIENDKNNKYAIKVLDLWRIKPNEYNNIIKRFKQEFKAGQVHSEYIVKSYFNGNLEGNPYIIMELCEFGNLGDRLLEFYNERDFTILALQILKGLDALHNQNMIHRDIKPENIIFKDKNTAKLTDFGISGDLKNRMTKVNWMGSAKEIWGTPLYSSPEQLNKKNSFKKAGPAMDIFSFAVLMFEVISSGQLPFATLEEINKTPLIYSERVKKGEFEDISKYRNDISSVWSKIFNKSLNPKPELRYNNIGEIISLIENIKLNNRNFEINKIVSEIYEKKPNNINNKKENGVFLLNLLSNEEFDLTKLLELKKNSIITIGRLDDDNLKSNDVSIQELNGRTISRKHATIEFEDLECFIRDGQWVENGFWQPSKNGTYVNDMEIDMEQGVKLQDLDIIKMGETLFKIIFK